MAICNKCGKDIQIHEAIAYLGFCHSCEMAYRMLRRAINKQEDLADASNHQRMEYERRKRIAEVKASFKPKKMGEE